MVAEQLLADAIDRTIKTAERCLASDSLIDYEELDVRFRALEAHAREVFQDSHRRLYEGIADKLDKGYPLSQVERGALELLIVGEAKYYLEEERNLEDWKRELKRITEEIQKAQVDSVTEAEKLLHLQALCNDAKGVLPDITFYLRERERIERFHEATSGEIRPEDGRFLAGVIRQMVSSEKR